MSEVNHVYTIEQNKCISDLSKACWSNNIKKIKTNILKLKEVGDINIIQDQLSFNFRTSCTDGRLDVVKVLLMSPELIYHADIHANNESGLRRAARVGNLDIVEYLLNSPDLKNKAILNEDVFIAAYKRDQYEVLRYFIFDLNIEYSEKISIHIKKGYVQSEVGNASSKNG